MLTRFNLEILKIIENENSLFDTDKKYENNIIYIFGIDIKYVNNIKYEDDIQILTKYAESIIEININIEFFHSHNLLYYFTDINLAILQNLSICNIILDNSIYKHTIQSNYDTNVYKNSESLYYIYKDKMSFVIYKNNDNITSDIKYLNIMNINKNNIYLLNNLPINIEYLHISSDGYYLDKFDNLNLPINLKKLKITLITLIVKDIDFNIKLPFGCKFKKNYIDYNM